MALTFKVQAVTARGGRRATMTLPHGRVETPVFMPVGTAATVKAVPQDVLENLGGDGAGAQILLGNTYHLYLRPGHEAVRRMGGLHRFMSWARPILTDSGGFQVFSLSDLRRISADGVEFRSHLDGSKHFFSPEHSMAVQLALGSDIAMAFDECLEYPAEWSRARASLDLTMSWAVRSKAYFDEHQNDTPWAQAASAPTAEWQASVPAVGAGATPSLFGIVQGGVYLDLRRESAERLVAMVFPG